MIDGHHDESADNETSRSWLAWSGPNYVNSSCDNCHHPATAARRWRTSACRSTNGCSRSRALKASRIRCSAPFLQPQGAGSSAARAKSRSRSGSRKNGLRSPQYAFAGLKPALFSARIAPQLVGMGLLEAIDEQTILAFEDVNDSNGDGISGKAQISAIR